jgi:hypothetical protein
LDDTVWELVSESLPEPIGALEACWIAATGQGIYYQPGAGQGFYRYDTASGWVVRESLPVAVTQIAAGDWDRDDTIYTLISGDDSFHFYSYSLAADTWMTLSSPSVQAELGVAIAAEPAGSKVLALAPDWGGHARFYKYDRSTGQWSQGTTPEWLSGSEPAFTFAGSLAFALTGTELSTPSWFWRHDPSLAAWDHPSRRDGVAGSVHRLSYGLRLSGPNPFNRRVSIEWQVPCPTLVSLVLYDAAGRLVKCLQRGKVPAGSYRASWDGTDALGRRLAAGVYVCKFRAGTYESTRKLVLTSTR